MVLRALEDDVQPPVAAQPGEGPFDHPADAGGDEPSIPTAGNRLIRLFGARDLHRTMMAMDDAGRRLSLCFLTQLALNTAFGCVIGLGLLLIGVQSPVLWGIVAALMRFVPYFGVLLSAPLPVALAAAVDPGWSMVAWTGALFLVGETTMG